MNPKAKNSCAERRAPSAERWQNWASRLPRDNLKKNSRGQTVLQTVGIDFAQVSPKSEKFYRRGKALWVREGENKVHESGKCFWPSCNEPKSSLFERRAPSAGRRAPSAERREKLSKQTAPRKSEKKFSRTNSITDPECNLIIVKTVDSKSYW